MWGWGSNYDGEMGLNTTSMCIPGDAGRLSGTKSDCVLRPINITTLAGKNVVTLGVGNVHNVVLLGVAVHIQIDCFLLALARRHWNALRMGRQR